MKVKKTMIRPAVASGLSSRPRYRPTISSGPAGSEYSRTGKGFCAENCGSVAAPGLLSPDCVRGARFAVAAGAVEGGVPATLLRVTSTPLAALEKLPPAAG